MHLFLPAGCALALWLLAAPMAARAAAPAADIATLRQELEALRKDYEARLQALERRLRAAEAASGDAAAAGSANANAAPEAAAAAPPTAASPTATAPAPASPTTATTSVAAPPAPGSAGAGFNPEISLILSGLYTRTSRDPSTYALAGIALPPDAETGPGRRGFSLAETELAMAASIDPWLRGAVNLAIGPDDRIAVEEAYVQTTSLGGGLTLKAGRFLANVGYLNPQHAHTWDFVDNPLAYQALLGTQLGDDGVQLAWLAPLDQYLEVAAQLGRGRGFPGDDANRNGAGLAALSLHAGGDIGESQSWRAGLSLIGAHADAQRLLPPDAPGRVDAFSGRTRTWIADAVWKWAPGGNATRTNLKLQGELLHATRSGRLLQDADGAALDGSYRAVQSGWYVQGVYQFMPRWRLGLRTERLDPGEPSFDGARLAPAAPRARKHTLMVDWSPSEFSRFRLQLADDRSRADGTTDRQLFLQYQTSLGAHGAHGY